MRFERIRNLLKGYKAKNESRIEDYLFRAHLFRKSLSAMLGLVIILVFLAVVVFAPLIAPYPEIYTDIPNRLLPPGTAHFFGTDDLGRDIFSRIVYGSRITLQIGIIVIALAYAIGLTLGSLSGYYGGLLDEVIMWFTNLMLGLPSILLALAITAALGSGLYNMMLALSFTWWPRSCRVVRSQVMQLRKAPYVEAVRAVGATDLRIIALHILPNSLGPILVQATVDFGWTVLVAASLGFLGIGAQAPSPEWGLMISIGRLYFLTDPWLTIFPGLAIFAVVLGTNLLGDGLRDVLDPRVARR